MQSSTDLIPSDIRTRARKSLILHEKWANFPYIDTKNKVTFGVGYNATDRGMTNQWISNQLNEDIDDHWKFLSQFDWFNELCEDRKIVLLDMSFMGNYRLMEFKNFINALVHKNFDVAADEMMNSLWANEVKERAVTLANAMRTGVYKI